MQRAVGILKPVLRSQFSSSAERNGRKLSLIWVHNQANPTSTRFIIFDSGTDGSSPTSQKNTSRFIPNRLGGATTRESGGIHEAHDGEHAAAPEFARQGCSASFSELLNQRETTIVWNPQDGRSPLYNAHRLQDHARRGRCGEFAHEAARIGFPQADLPAPGDLLLAV